MILYQHYSFFTPGDLIEIIGSFPHDTYETNQFEDPIIIYTDTRPHKPIMEPDRPKPDWNYFHVKPSYHETTTVYPGYESGDDYVPVHVARPSYPGMFYLFNEVISFFDVTILNFWKFKICL